MRRLIDSAQAAISHAASFRAGYVDKKRDDGVAVDGVAFTSRVLRRNLDFVGRVFPFVLTLGSDMGGLIDASVDMLEKRLLDEITNMALREARGRFGHHLRSAFSLEKISCMASGSLEDWPIEQQAPLFSLRPGVEAALGVRLTESFLMLPRKSISGIYFPSETTFFSCQLCPCEYCDGRKAATTRKKRTTTEC
ncbi:MAG: vitamin B12 dependent methionine synthase [Desulfobacteraceae bacterium]|nr:MAG: vitamin B12 dependent methionine synthase [Desulfobacteraceae bacterium]